MVTEKPPYDATVENIRNICKECRDVSSAEGDDLKEKTEGLDGTTFDRNLEAAVLLGLFEKDDDGLYTPTKQGKKIGYGPDDGEEVEIFRDIVKDYLFYNELLEIVGDELKEDDGEHYLSRDKVMKQIGINFDFGVGDRTLESASSTFLRVLDAAGIGSYRQGRGSYPTRLVINDEYTGFVESVTKAGGTDHQEDQVDTEKDEEIDEKESAAAEQSELDDVQGGDTVHEFDSTDSGQTSAQELDSGRSLEAGNKEYTDENHEGLIVNNSTDGPITIQIDIDISSSDWECDDVIKVIEAVQSE